MLKWCTAREGSAAKYGKIDQDDMPRLFSDLVVERYGVSILEPNNEEFC